MYRSDTTFTGGDQFELGSSTNTVDWPVTLQPVRLCLMIGNIDISWCSRQGALNMLRSMRTGALCSEGEGGQHVLTGDIWS